MEVFMAQLKLIILVLVVVGLLLGVYIGLAKHVEFESVYQSVVGSVSSLLKRGRRGTGSYRVNNVRRPTPRKTVQNRGTGGTTPGAVPVKQKAYQSKTLTYCEYELEELDATLQNVVKSFPLPFGRKPLIIGVAQDADIVIEEKGHEYVSHYHAAIALDSQGLYLKDNRSTNGTYDQDKQAVKHLDLQENDIFYLSKKHPFRIVYKG